MFNFLKKKLNKDAIPATTTTAATTTTVKIKPPTLEGREEQSSRRKAKLDRSQIKNVKNSRKKSRSFRASNVNGLMILESQMRSVEMDTVKTVSLSVNYNKHMGTLIKKFVDDVLQKKVIGLIAEFRHYKRLNDYSKMTVFLANNAFGRNRYKDVGCLDNSRVALSLGPVAYIHANYVSTPKNPKKFICTQGPLPNTCADFWYMCIQEQVNVALMLCNYVEMGSNKCANYFPTSPGQSMIFGQDNELKVTAKSVEMYAFPFETKVRIQITICEILLHNKPHICKHYHWLDWPDRGVPEADMAPIHLLSLLEKTTKPTSPIVVHCSAGIGRTGSIVLLQIAMEILRDGQTLEPMSTYMENIRRQRNNSVQTEQQYLYVHQVLLLYLRHKGYIDISMHSLLDGFTKEYDKATTGF